MVSSDAHVRVDAGRLWLSSLFDWYRDDFVSGSFTNGASSLAEYVSRHARPERRRMIEALGRSPSIGFLEYDWSLNGTTAGRGVP